VVTQHLVEAQTTAFYHRRLLFSLAADKAWSAWALLDSADQEAGKKHQKKLSLHYRHSKTGGLKKCLPKRTRVSYSSCFASLSMCPRWILLTRLSTVVSGIDMLFATIAGKLVERKTQIEQERELRKKHSIMISDEAKGQAGDPTQVWGCC
jgi:hypothetical protein